MKRSFADGGMNNVASYLRRVISPYGEYTHTLRLISKLIELRVGYASGHNEAVLKICEQCRRKNSEKPCKH